VRDAARLDDVGPRGRGDDLVADQDRDLALKDVRDLVLVLVAVGRSPEDTRRERVLDDRHRAARVRPRELGDDAEATLEDRPTLARTDDPRFRHGNPPFMTTERH
jgi:hypothetical protein